MCRKTWCHNDAVITHCTTPHPTVIISSASNPHPPSNEGPMPHASRPAMWWWIFNKLWCNPYLPMKRRTATYRHQRPYIMPILHRIWRTYPSTTWHEPHRPYPSPTSTHKWDQVLLRPPYDYQIRFGTIYLHQSELSQVPSTWIKAIECGHYASWPGLTT